jgi:CRP-like cAMP-binding protein
MDDPMDLRPETLSDLDIFAGCPVGALALAASVLQARRVPTGTVLLEEGAGGDGLLVIAGGTAAVTRDAGDGIEHVADLRAGAVAGELSLLEGGLHTVTVTATTAMQLCVGDPESFGVLLGLPVVGDRIARIAAARLEQLGTPGAIATTLPDGTQVVLRPVEPADKGRLAAAFERCSVQTRYRRFLSGGFRLTEGRLAAVTEIDHAGHVGWVAAAPGEPGSPVIALASYVRDPNAPGNADIAFTVIDEYQGRGLGGLLFDALRVAAGVHGVRRFTADVLWENVPMRTLLRRRGATVRSAENGVVAYVLDIAHPPLAETDARLERALWASATAATGTAA